MDHRATERSVHKTAGKLEMHIYSYGYEIFLSIAGYVLEFIHQNKKILDKADLYFKPCRNIMTS